MPLPTLSELERKYTHLDGNGKKKRKDSKSVPMTVKSRGRTPDEDVQKTKKEQSLEDKQKDELVDIFLNENEDMPLDKIITYLLKNNNNGKGGKKTGKTTSSLSGIRKTLEDFVNIDQLVELIKQLRSHRTNGGEKDGDDGDDNSGNMMGGLVNMLPILTSLQNGGTDEMGVLELMQLMSSMGGNNNNDMGAFGMQLLLTKVLTQINNNKGNGSNNVDPDMISNLVNQFQQIMDREKQNKNFFSDPTSIMQMKLLNKVLNEDKQDTNVILDKISHMYEKSETDRIATILERQDYKFQKMMETLAGRLAPQNDMNKFMQFLEVYKQIKGKDDTKGLTKEDIEWRLQNRKIDLEEKRLEHELNRDQWESQVENEKSLEVIKGGLGILNNFLGDGNLNTLLNMLGKSKGNTQIPQQERSYTSNRTASTQSSNNSGKPRRKINFNKLKEL